MFESLSKYFDYFRNLLYSQKRKHDEKDASDLDVYPVASKRFRPQISNGNQHNTLFDSSNNSYDQFSRRRKMAHRSENSSSSPVYDISDDEDSDVEYLKTVPHSSRNFKTTSQSSEIEILAEFPPSERSRGHTDGEYSRNCYAREVGSFETSPGGRGSRLSLKLDVLKTKPSSSRSYKSPSRSRQSDWKIPNTTLENIFPNLYKSAPRPLRSEYFASKSALENLVKPSSSGLFENDSSPKRLDRYDSVTTLDTVVSPYFETDDKSKGIDLEERDRYAKLLSQNSSSREESESPGLKRCTSLDRLDNVRFPLAEFNERFKMRSPMNWRSMTVQNSDNRARRAEAVSKLVVEAEIRRNERLKHQKSNEDNVRLRMRLEGLLIEDEVPIEEFPELTSEHWAVIKKAIGPGSLTQVLATGFNYEITRKDLHTLAGKNWLNDEVINFYFQLLVERSGKNGVPTAYAVLTQFYPKLLNEDWSRSTLRRWTRKVDIFSYDLVLVPVHLGNHWCFAVIDFRRKVIRYFDSMGGENDTALEALLNYLRLESLDKKKVEYDTSGWELIHETDIPYQQNGSDCGVFACRFAECVSRDAPINFDQEHMNYFRHRMIYEIVTKRLM